jgi:uncharacterized protein (TIRG00374 family)
VSKTRVLLVLFGLALSAAAIVMLGRSIDVGEAMRAMGRASIPWFLAANLLTIVVYWLRSLRWRSLLKPHASPTVGRLFRANMVGFLAINILPARLGELVRAFALARKERISTAAVLGSVAVERILDLVFLGIFWALSLLFAPLPSWFKWSGYATIAIAVVVGGGIWFLNAARGRSSRLRTGVMTWVPHRMKDRFSASVSAFGEGIQIVGKPALLLEAAFWSAASWLVSCGTFLLVGWSLGITLPLWSTFLLTFIICVGISLPSSPGFIGVMEWACVVGLGYIGVRGPEALAFAILYHLTQLLPLVILGTYFAIREHLAPIRLVQPETIERASNRKD